MPCTIKLGFLESSIKIPNIPHNSSQIALNIREISINSIFFGLITRKVPPVDFLIFKNSEQKK